MAQTSASVQAKGILQTGEVWFNGKPLFQEKSLESYNHGPTGFSWGHGGSGPAQLALAVLLEILPQKKALGLRQDFKWKFIATFPRGDFEAELDVSGRLNEALGMGAMVTVSPGSRRGPRYFCHRALWEGDTDGMA